MSPQNVSAACVPQCPKVFLTLTASSPSVKSWIADIEVALAPLIAKYSHPDWFALFMSIEPGLAAGDPVMIVTEIIQNRDKIFPNTSTPVSEHDLKSALKATSSFRSVP